MPRPRIAESMADAVAAIPDGSTIIIPGFGGAGFPWNLLTALYHQGTRDLTLVTNSLNIASANPEAKAITDMVTDGRVRKVIASFTASTHPSRASVPEQMARDGRLEVELVPQGTLAERIRSGGAGIPAFWTPAGVGTMLAEGKEHRDFEGETYILEDAIFADYALVRAHRGDTAGNLLFRRAARNFNPIAGMAARHTIAEVEQPIEDAGSIDPDDVHLAGVFVGTVAGIPADGFVHVERSGRPDAGAVGPAPLVAPAPGEKRRLTRHELAAVIAQRLEPGWLVNLGIGIPTFASNYVRAEDDITFTSENGVVGYSRLAAAEEGDPDIVNAGGQQVTLVDGASFVHHADSFAVVRSGRLDVTVLGAYEVGADGSFANWRLSTEPFDHLGGIGGAMDLVARAKQVWLAMEHTTREGGPRLLDRCTLPLTGKECVTLIVTDLGVIAVQDGRFILEEHAPGHTFEEIAALTGGPIEASPTLRPVDVWGAVAAG
ncbi:MAG: 3-oxoacid CoA-transferase subunit A [Dehalococcoidia bacterium]|nr:3-oxoacid CoA-transferase subunit A [Dehalococcoidia bacterium]